MVYAHDIPKVFGGSYSTHKRFRHTALVRFRQARILPHRKSLCSYFAYKLLKFTIEPHKLYFYSTKRKSKL